MIFVHLSEKNVNNHVKLHNENTVLGKNEAERVNVKFQETQSITYFTFS